MQPGAALAASSVPERNCPQCGGDAARALAQYSTPEWHVVACADCGFVYLRNPPDYERLEDEFAWEKTKPLENERRRQKRPVLADLERRTRWRLGLFRQPRSAFYRGLFRPGRVLDVGCGASISVREPYVPYGIEISKGLYDEVAPKMAARGGAALLGPAAVMMASYPAGYFSGVILRSVAEHEKQPRQLLAETARVLEPDGVAYIRVPNFGSINRRVVGADWCGFRHPDHVNYFTLKSLSRMASDAGLKLRVLRPLTLALDDNINAVLTHA